MIEIVENVLIDPDLEYEVPVKRRTLQSYDKRFSQSYTQKVTDSGNANVMSLQKSFSEAAGAKQRELKVNMENNMKMQEEVAVKEGMAVMAENKAEKIEEEKRTFLYRTYNNHAHKINWFSE